MLEEAVLKRLVLRRASSLEQVAILLIALHCRPHLHTLPHTLPHTSAYRSEQERERARARDCERETVSERERERALNSGVDLLDADFGLAKVVAAVDSK